MPRQTNVGQHLIRRLREIGIGHIFGVPGDYVLGFYDMLVASDLHVIGTCTEAGAGFAADAYARVNGIGALCVTYCVGGLNALNAVAGAYAEKSPLVVISGAPGLGERTRSSLLHHMVRDFNTQQLIFANVTVEAAAIENASTAAAQIDHALASCIRHKRPVYIELPRDIVAQPCEAPGPFRMPTPKSNPETLEEAVAESVELLRKARRPVVLAGVEIHRFGLQSSLVKLVEATGMPVAATLLGKSVIRENHPQYLGVYEGAMGREDVRKTVERADCVLILGAFMTDINLGVYTANLDPAKSIYATSERIAIKRHAYEDVTLKDFIDGLIDAKWGRSAHVKHATREPKPFKAKPKAPVTVRRFFECMNDFIDDNTIVISDIGDSLFGAADLTIRKRTEFLSPAYYTSMGFAVPAALGAQLSRPSLRPLVFVGDGAFQMTGQELSTIVRCGLNPIIFVLNNKGYTTERFIADGPYNDILNWSYHKWTEVLGFGVGLEVRTENELSDAVRTADRNAESFSIVNVHLDPYDRSFAMERLAKRLRERATKRT